MLKTENIIHQWVLAGTIVLIVFGSILHFAFEWSEESMLVGFISPVNESVWEHLKMGYWSLAIFSIFEYQILKNHIHNYFLARLIGILALELTIIIVFYSYTYIAHDHILWIDILSYLLGVIMCQRLVAKVQQRKPVSPWVNRISMIGFICVGLLLGLTTYYPPHHDLFKDSRNDTFGINGER